MDLWTPGAEHTAPSVSTVLADNTMAGARRESARRHPQPPHSSFEHPSYSTAGVLRNRAMFGSNTGGVTLIEVMVSLMILTVGLLGIAALHGLGVKYGYRSYFRSQAVHQAYDILDRMRANPGGVSAGMYAQTPTPTEARSTCLHSPCSTSEIAGYDLGEWNRTNSSLLPSGSGAVSTDGPNVSVVVSWQESDHGGKAETKSVRAAARL